MVYCTVGKAINAFSMDYYYSTVGYTECHIWCPRYQSKLYDLAAELEAWLGGMGSRASRPNLAADSAALPTSRTQAGSVYLSYNEMFYWLRLLWVIIWTDRNQCSSAIVFIKSLMHNLSQGFIAPIHAIFKFIASSASTSVIHCKGFLGSRTSTPSSNLCKMHDSRHLNALIIRWLY